MSFLWSRLLGKFHGVICVFILSEIVFAVIFPKSGHPSAIRNHFPQCSDFRQFWRYIAKAHS